MVEEMSIKWMDKPSVTETDRGGVYKMDTQFKCQKMEMPHSSTCSKQLFNFLCEIFIETKGRYKKDDWDLAIQHCNKGPLQYKFLSNKAKIFTFLQPWLAYWNGYKAHKLYI